MPSERSTLLPSHEGDRTDYQAVKNGVEQNARRAQQQARRTEQKLEDARPDIEYALAALKAGKLPTTQQATQWIDWVQNLSLLQEGTYEKTGALSDEGARIVGDIKDVLQQLKTIAESKNGDDKLQKFIFHTQQLDEVEAHIADPSSYAPSRREARADAQKALAALRQLGYLIIGDDVFNSLISDIIVLARDILADAASNAADELSKASKRARPSEDQRHGSGKDRRQKLLDIDQDSAKRQGRELKRNYIDGTGVQQKADQAAEHVRQWVDERTPDDAKDQLIERLKKTVVSVQSKTEYQDAIDALIDLVKKYASTARDVVNNTVDDSTVNTEAGHVEHAADNFKAIIEAVANGQSLDPLIESFSKVADDIQKDERLRSYFEDLGKFIERLLKDEGYVLTSKASRRVDTFYDRAQELMESNADWKKHAKALNDQLRAYSEYLTTDEESRALVEALRRLSIDMQSVAEQTLALLRGEAKGLYRDLLDVWLPRAISSIKQVPLPKIEYKSEDLDVIVDGINLQASGANFIPDRIQIVNHNEAQLLNGYAAFATTLDSSMTVSIEGIRLKATDVAYYFNRKNAYIHKRDWGLLSLDCGGSGISAVISVEKAGAEDWETYYKVKDVDVNISQLKISTRKSHHPLSNWLFTRLARPALKSVIAKLLEEQLADQFRQFDKKLWSMHERSVALSKYSGSAYSPFSRGGGTPSIVGYFQGLFGQGLSPFSMFGGSSSSGLSADSSRGIIKKGRSGEWLLAIGAPTPIISEAHAGPSGWAQQHQKDLDHAKQRLQMLSSKGRAEVRKSSQNVDNKARKMADEADWRSDAFDMGGI